MRLINEIGVTIPPYEQNVKQELANAHHDYVRSQGRAITANDAAMLQSAEVRAAF